MSISLDTRVGAAPPPPGLLADPGGDRGDLALQPFQVAQAGALTAVPGARAGTMQLSVPDPLRLTLPLSRAGVWGAVLSLSGDTPQPQEQSYGGVNLYVSPDGKNAWFTRDAGALISAGPLEVLPHEEALSVPVQIDGGQVSFDRASLERAYGAPLPRELLDQAKPAPVESTRASPTGSRALSTETAAARAVAANPRKLQDWQAHHLIPFNVANEPEFAPKMLQAAQAGWKLDSTENVIALPATKQAFEGPPNNGALPQHSGSHPKYDNDVRQLLRLNFLGATTSADIHTGLKRVEAEMTVKIFDEAYHPQVR